MGGVWLCSYDRPLQAVPVEGTLTSRGMLGLVSRRLSRLVCSFSMSKIILGIQGDKPLPGTALSEADLCGMREVPSDKASVRVGEVTWGPSI